MQKIFRVALFLALLGALCSAQARAGKVALLLEEPYGQFGSMNPTGHAAVYLSDVCAETPVRLRRCEPGETGVVLSRYHRIGGYDWIAMPLMPYLYAVNNSDGIPVSADSALAMRMRNEYRRTYLMQYAPDDPNREIPAGDWAELVGESYDRKIYGFSLDTRPEQDDALIAILNDSRNRSHFNLLFSNCANFAEKILNFYFPHSIHRNFIADAGVMTPKQTARSLQKYAKRHSDLEFTTFVIPQVPGTIHRSTPVHGVIESLVESKKYVLPLACLHPVIAASLLAVYFGNGRFHPAAHVDTVFDPRVELEPGIVDAAQLSPTTETSGALRTVALRP
ncbi:MAG TPA: hypothetical protein VFW25_03895 [Silvibacterium sp.]|nr:hypothetical protein [Silvibacterium sp.]